MKCPVCRAIYRPSRINEDSPVISSTCCRRCSVDLAPLISLHDLALLHHRAAIQSFKSGDLVAAIAQNQHAIAIYFHNADFHVFAGQILALQGEFNLAIAAWHKAMEISPQQTKAHEFLQLLESELTQSCLV
jgi:tetratricopeptide (TPR) repeat protein